MINCYFPQNFFPYGSESYQKYVMNIDLDLRKNYLNTIGKLGLLLADTKFWPTVHGAQGGVPS